MLYLSQRRVSPLFLELAAAPWPVKRRCAWKSMLHLGNPQAARLACYLVPQLQKVVLPSAPINQKKRATVFHVSFRGAVRFSIVW